jgi:hypothetical protein
MPPLPNYTAARKYRVHRYITSPLTTWPPSETPHSQLASPFHIRHNTTWPHSRHAAFTNIDMHGVTAAAYTHTSQYNMVDTPNNIAAERHPTFTITHLHGVTPAACTYVTIQHGRHADSTNLRKKFSFRLIPTMPSSGRSGFNRLHTTNVFNWLLYSQLSHQVPGLNKHVRSCHLCWSWHTQLKVKGKVKVDRWSLTSNVTPTPVSPKLPLRQYRTK